MLKCKSEPHRNRSAHAFINCPFPLRTVFNDNVSILSPQKSLNMNDLSNRLALFALNTLSALEKQDLLGAKENCTAMTLHATEANFRKRVQSEIHHCNGSIFISPTNVAWMYFIISSSLPECNRTSSSKSSINKDILSPSLRFCDVPLDC